MLKSSVDFDISKSDIFSISMSLSDAIKGKNSFFNRSTSCLFGLAAAGLKNAYHSVGNSCLRLKMRLSGNCALIAKELRQFDYDSISDAVMHMRHTAREDAGTFRNNAVDYLKSTIAAPRLEFGFLRSCQIQTI